MRAPMIPTASTPKYIRLAGSPALPMVPAPRPSQTRMNEEPKRLGAAHGARDSIAVRFALAHRSIRGSAAYRPTAG
jgi:hypothetical protein